MYTCENEKRNIDVCYYFKRYNLYSKIQKNIPIYSEKSVLKKINFNEDKIEKKNS